MGRVPYWKYIWENSIRIWKIDLGEKFGSNPIRIKIFTQVKFSNSKQIFSDIFSYFKITTKTTTAKKKKKEYHPSPVKFYKYLFFNNLKRCNFKQLHLLHTNNVLMNLTDEKYVNGSKAFMSVTKL